MKPIQVQFLGSGDAFGSGGRLQTCILVTATTSTFLIDCGATALIAMRRFGVNPNHIDLILLTHLHGDHFGGIPLDIRELVPEQPATFDEVTVTPYPVQHPSGDPSLALRIRCAGKILMYTGDTAWTEALIAVDGTCIEV